MTTFTAPSVIKKGSHTAIVVLSLSERISTIAVTDDALRIRTTHHAVLADEGWAVYDYDVATAARRYLAHTAGVTNDARRALEAIIDSAVSVAPVLSPVKETTTMSIEQNLARIADALEKLAAAGTLTTVVAQVEDTSAKDAEEAVKKAATKGRGKKADPTPEPEVTEDTPPAAAKPEVKEEAPVVVTINVTDVQKRAAKLAAAHGKDNIFKLIGRQGTDKISAHTAEQLVALNTAFDQLEAGDEELMAFLKGEEAFD